MIGELLGSTCFNRGKYCIRLGFLVGFLLHYWDFNKSRRKGKIFLRRGKKNKYGSGPLIFENACARAGNIFLLQIFYQLINTDLSFFLSFRVCEKYETKFDFFVATLYCM